MPRLLTASEVARCIDLADLLPVVADAFRAQHRGNVERPARPHFPVGFAAASDPSTAATDAAGMGLTMPAYIHGRDVYATKLVAVHDENPARGLPTIHAQIAVTNADDGRFEALMDGAHVTGARTGCIGGLAVRELTDGPITVGIVGAGTQARWQARAIATATDVTGFRVFSRSNSRVTCAEDLADELGVPAEPVASASAAVSGVDVVVTTTPSTSPVLAAEDLDPGTLVVGIGAYDAETHELPAGVFERAGTVLADVPEEVVEIGDLDGTGLSTDDLVPLGALLDGDVPRPTDEDLTVVESVGSAVLDAATAEYVLDEAETADVGSTISL